MPENKIITCEEVCQLIAETLSLGEGEWIEDIANKTLPNDTVKYLGDSMFSITPTLESKVNSKLQKTCQEHWMR